MSTYTAVQYSPSMIGKLSESQKNVIENDTSGTDSTTNFNSDEAASSNSDGYPTGNATAAESNKEETKNPPYTMNGVLHYIQHEWSRHELERAQWEMERAELKAKISFLVGERKAQENLKKCFVRRIKMLEYSLRQERAKYHRLTHDGEEPPNHLFSPGLEDSDNEETGPNRKSSVVPLDVDAIIEQEKRDAQWESARQTLRQCLQEVGCGNGVLDAHSFRAKHLLGLNPDGCDMLKSTENKAINLQRRAYHLNDDQVEDNEIEWSGVRNDENRSGSLLDDDAIEALNEFNFLSPSKLNQQQVHSEPRIGGKQRHSLSETKEIQMNSKHVKHTSLDELKRQFRSEQEAKRTGGENRRRGKEKIPPKIGIAGSADSSQHNLHLDPVFDSNSNDETDKTMMDKLQTDEDICELIIQDQTRDANPDANPSDHKSSDSEFEPNIMQCVDESALYPSDEELSPQPWTLYYSCRSHYDAVRALQFHPTDSRLITASDDGTAKLWDCGIARSNSKQSSSNGIIELEPVYTFRGHKGPILTIDMSSTGDMLYTAGLDGKVCCWMVPETTGADVYGPYDTSILQETLRGHEDSIWSLVYHSSTNQLISGSSDGTIRLWTIGATEGVDSLIKTYYPPASLGPNVRPRSLDVVWTEPSQLLVAYSGGHLATLDLETGQVVSNFQETNNGESLGCEIDRVLAHPTISTTIAACADRKIRFFDNNTGKVINSIVAHVEAISSLAIDPNGLYLLSGSHDGSIRLWNMEKRMCLQEIPAHRKKFEEGTLAVAFHPSQSLIASAGADSLAKVFGNSSGQQDMTAQSPNNLPYIMSPDKSPLNNTVKHFQKPEGSSPAPSVISSGRFSISSGTLPNSTPALAPPSVDEF